MILLKNIFIAALTIGIFSLHPSLNKGQTPITYLQHAVYGNSLDISTNINKDLLEIKWICKTQGIACKDLIIFKGGKQINDIPSEKGLQKLVVYYKNQLIAEMSQEKKVGNQAHQYKIELTAKNNSLFFKSEINGPSPSQGHSIIITSL